MTTPTRITITSAGRALVRVSDDDGEISVESNLGEDASVQAIGDAMARLGRSVDAEEQARAEAAAARGQQDPLQAVARVLARMVSEMNADLRADFDVDLGDAWRAASSSSN